MRPLRRSARQVYRVYGEDEYLAQGEDEHLAQPDGGRTLEQATPIEGTGASRAVLALAALVSAVLAVGGVVLASRIGGASEPARRAIASVSPSSRSVVRPRKPRARGLATSSAGTVPASALAAGASARSATGPSGQPDARRYRARFWAAGAHASAPRAAGAGAVGSSAEASEAGEAGSPADASTSTVAPAPGTGAAPAGPSFERASASDPDAQAPPGLREFGFER